MSEQPTDAFSSSSIRKGARWLRGVGSQSDVVVSSRVRLARNFTGFPFLTRANLAQRQQILDTARQCILGAGLSDRMAWLDIHRTPQLDRSLMVERHLISKEHAKGAEPRGVAISLPDEQLAIMVNEEDHLRIQVLRSGLELADAFRQISDVDDRIDAAGDDGPAFAFSTRFGFLTACPTNVGTGIRVSVMLHLPGLRLTGELEKVQRATRDMSLAVRGFYGEGSENIGDFFQISNQTTLGKSEGVILHELENEILPKVIDYERASRAQLMQKRRRTLEDQVFRAVGILRNARLLKADEGLGLLSMVRLGILAGLITDLDEQCVNQLVLLTQPAHLQRAVGRAMNQGQRREARADLVRARLAPS